MRVYDSGGSSFLRVYKFLLPVLCISACGPATHSQPSGGNHERATPSDAPEPVPAEAPPATSPHMEPSAPAEVVVVPARPATPPPGAPPGTPHEPVPVQPMRRELPGAIWPPPGYVPPQCQLELSTVAVRRDGAYRITARVRNKTRDPLSFELPNRCPQGPVTFHGLPEGHDYYGTCAMGACPGPAPPHRYTVPPGTTVELASVTVDPRGGTCAPPLGPGTYTITFQPPRGIFTCFGSVAKIDNGRPPPPPPMRPLPPAPGMPPSCPPHLTCGQ